MKALFVYIIMIDKFWTFVLTTFENTSTYSWVMKNAVAHGAQVSKYKKMMGSACDNAIKFRFWKSSKYSETCGPRM